MINVKREVVKAAKIIILSGMVCASLNQWVFRHAIVEGRSMDPTFYTGQGLFVNCWSPKFFDINVGDVVTARDPEGYLVVKRVIGRPGDVIEFSEDGYVTQNGFRLKETYLGPGRETYCDGRFKLMKLGSDQYCLLGDNRSVSIDSRYYGPVAGNSIIGIVQ